MAERDPDIAYLAAVAAQAKASDPGRTRFVSANAGSGKTHVLVGRVSRLLLSGVEPDHILCLTYTKAAAAEMQARLFDKLGGWSVMDDAQLAEQLDNLTLGEQAVSLPAARGLFAKALETPEGLKVQTIHAFCADVLKRFPMEAGILPGFDQADESGEGALKEAVRRQILHQAWYDPRSDLARHLTEVARKTANQTLDELFHWMGGKTRQIQLYTTEEGLAQIASMLGVPADTCEIEETRRAWRETPIETLKELIEPLRSGSKQCVDQAVRLTEALYRSETCELSAWERYLDVFLTSSGGWRASVVPKGAPEIARAFFGHKDEPDTPERARVERILQRINAASVVSGTRRLGGLARAYADTYVETKRARRTLDFNDQIHHVHDLLTRREAADWVRYKLDAGISHILIDEAQDTSDLQWGIVDALRESFDPADERTGTESKTFFAVGDEKQSIYGFQGAKPATFIDRINHAGEDKVVRMAMSFRSAPEILKAVDSVFVTHGAGQRMFGAAIEGVAGDASHSAKRSDRGRVELWPILPNPPDDAEEDAWNPRPVDALDTTHPKEKLAQLIAKQIVTWLKTGEPVFDRDKGCARPMHAGDIFILVQKRDAFFDAMIRNLKSAGVPVAGADRLVLADSVVVKDLLALARWALFPRDDLSLAEVLKSPLFAYNEDDLFRVAFGRDASLWEALSASTHAQDISTRDLLAAIQSSVTMRDPYSFFVSALDQQLDGESLRLRIEKRLGVEHRDPLNEFLGQVLAFQRRTSASLQHFVQEWDNNSTELKREPDGQASEVRIMTVHGSKGLQAPVVILPQTTTAPKSGKAGDIMEIPLEDGGTMFVTRPKKDTVPALDPYIQAADCAAEEEHLRLLYVAMTRAESRLVVCGYPQRLNTKDPDKYAHEKSWYTEVAAGLDHLDCEEIDTPAGSGKLYGGPPDAPLRDDTQGQGDLVILPHWVAELAIAEASSATRVTPSHLLSDSDEGPVRSPLSRTHQAERDRRFLRGNLIHKLLEVLPDIPVDRRRPVADAILGRHDLSKPVGDRILEEVFTVLDRFPQIFAEGSFAEVSLAGTGGNLPEGMRLNAQVDRLTVTPEHVYIIDYKSNRPPPESQDAVSGQYMAQMAAYRELAREIYGRPVTCALLWTDSAHLMELDEGRLDAALDQVANRLTKG